MITKRISTFLAAFTLLCAGTHSGQAQGTAFTYQGRLSDGSAPANGAYDLTFTLFSVSSGPGQVGNTLTNLNTAVGNGLFTVTLDFSTNFPGADRWLEIGVRTNGAGAPAFTLLAPRQKLTPTPYAITAGDVTSANIARLDVPNTATTATGVPVVNSGFVTSATLINGGSGYLTAPTVTINDVSGAGAVLTANISGGKVVSFSVSNPGSGYSGGATLTVGAAPSNAYQTFPGLNYFTGVNSFSNPNNLFTGNGAGLTGVNAGSLNGLSATNFWKTSGNAGTTPGANFIGTPDNQPLELKVNGQRALRLEPNSSGAPNLIGGGPFNQVDAGIVGGTISGGGATNYSGSSSTNRASSDFATIAGGMNNMIQSNSIFSTISGGNGGSIQAHSDYSSIGGGIASLIGTNAPFATVGGGYLNQILASSGHSTIAGGNGNLISTNSGQSAIGGGGGNLISPNTGQATIGGGGGNTIRSSDGGSVIAGGTGNVMFTNSYNAVIGGGYNNTMMDNNAYSSISGGALNTIQSYCSYAKIGGGLGNVIQYNSGFASIANGVYNTVRTNGTYSTIGGGYTNTVDLFSYYATIAGGASNTVAAPGAMVPGGTGNQALGNTSFAAGQNARAAHNGAFVWADTSTASSFSSTAANQFLVRAAGGVGIDTASTPEGDFCINTNTCLFSHVLYFRGETVPDHNHGLAYCGFTVTNFAPTVLPDGPVLWGFSGGVLGTAAGGNKAVLTWTPSQITTSVPINPPSDRNVKSAFASIDPREMLQRVCDLPVTSWAYTNALDVRHIGPVAQDFFAAFKVGMDDKHIATVDAEGVALAAIQGLNQKLDEKDARIAGLEKNMAELREAVALLTKNPESK